ncbi:MAG: hypothetical protein ACOZIN_11025 [Myxococcota bacterium]
MKSSFAVAALTFAAACTPDIKQEPAPRVVRARFDPAATPPVVPTPNDLAEDPVTGQLRIVPGPNATPADLELIAFLNMLNGFPNTSVGSASFTGALDPSSVTPGSVVAFNLTRNVQVTGLLPRFSAQDIAEAPGEVNVPPPPGGWTPGDRFAIAMIGGANGLKGADGEQVAGTPAWGFVRAKNSLVTCEDLTSPDCRTTTELIPSTQTDPEARLAEQTQIAISLERLRRKYEPAIDAVVNATGVSREEIALLWTFRTTDMASVAFNPAVGQVPTPTDLVLNPATGRVNAPIDPFASPAQQEFTRDYLNTLDGFPVSSTATATVMGGTLDPATVSARTVIFQELSPTGSGVTPDISYDATDGAIDVTPPGVGWPKGARFAIAIRGGPNGVKTVDGKSVVGSEVWALVRSEKSLVTCQDLASPDCAPTITVTSLTTVEAIALERIRRALAPLLDQLSAQGIPRAEVAALWTFTVVSLPMATFDPAAGVIPFPNDVLLQNGLVKLPTPPNATAEEQMLIAGLNTLDGFSTTAEIVSENAPGEGPLDSGDIDPATLSSGTGFLKLQQGGTAPQVEPCLSCVSSKQTGGGPSTARVELQFVPKVPLDERSHYAAFINDALMDTSGKPVVATPQFALLRLTSPLVDANGKSQVSGVSDAQAAQLEPVRQGMKPLFDMLAAAGQERRALALAWTFTTQSEFTALTGLQDVPHQLGSQGLLPTSPEYLVDITASALAGSPLPSTSIGKIFTGVLTLPHLLTGPGGTLQLPPSGSTVRAPFLLITPASAAPSGGYPVVLFGHGLSRGGVDALGIANTLAAGGFATIAIDTVFHGERSTCTGSAAFLGAASDDAACADRMTQRCSPEGRCVARNPSERPTCDPNGAVPGDLLCALAGLGACVPDGVGGNLCEGGDFARDATGVPHISGWNFIDSSNLFATRDHFRQPVADWAQVTRMLVSNGNGSLNTLLGANGPINGSQLHFVGQSLGGILGTLHTASSAQVRRAVLNVPGGRLPDIILQSPAFAEQRDALLDTLAARGIEPGTFAFDNFLRTARWIVDPADPVNLAFETESSGIAPADRQVLVHFIEGDPVIPNSTTRALIDAANRSPTVNVVSVVMLNPSLSELPTASRHGFLLNFVNPTITATAQETVVGFVSTGNAP